jgi:hypothetical protein
MKERQGIITIAVGKKYIKQAKYLALSGILNSPQTLRCVITDKPDSLKKYYDLVLPYTAELGDPFALKTKLNTFTPFLKTLYLDADSLIINNVDAFFSLLDKKPFVYFGNKITTGVWYADIKGLINHLDLEWLPQINSGMFLFNTGEAADSIFETAHYYISNQEKENLQIPFFRGASLPDEPFFSISLAKHHEEPYIDYGRFSRSLIKARKIHLNTPKHIAFFIKDNSYVFPQVVHFCGRKGALYYLREKIRLWLYFHL